MKYPKYLSNISVFLKIWLKKNRENQSGCLLSNHNRISYSSSFQSMILGPATWVQAWSSFQRPQSRRLTWILLKVGSMIWARNRLFRWVWGIPELERRCSGFKTSENGNGCPTALCPLPAFSRWKQRLWVAFSLIKMFKEI